ncbi:MAG: type VI secretion system ATPase TssH, partial [Candidatus Hinthialibacter sp.]
TEQSREQALRELRAHCRPEFLNRVDDIVLFKTLHMDEIEKIVDLLLDEVRKRLQDRQMKLEVSPEAKENLAIRGYDLVYGARPLRRLIQRELETKIGRALLTGDILD